MLGTSPSMTAMGLAASKPMQSGPREDARAFRYRLDGSSCW